MFWIIVLLVIIAIVLRNKALQVEATTADKQNNYSIDSKEVGKDYANEAIKFFDNYLSLCQSHSVMATCDLLSLGTDEFGVNTRMTCIITAIDGEHADEVFYSIKRTWLQLRQEKMNAGDYSAVTYAGDGYIKQYFGCEDLHYVFTEADEYQFENGQVIMSFDRPLFTREGTKWQATLLAIKQELQQKWPNATITVDKNGIIVKPQ